MKKLLLLALLPIVAEASDTVEAIKNAKSAKELRKLLEQRRQDKEKRLEENFQIEHQKRQQRIKKRNTPSRSFEAPPEETFSTTSDIAPPPDPNVFGSSTKWHVTYHTNEFNEVTSKVDRIVGGGNGGMLVFDPRNNFEIHLHRPLSLPRKVIVAIRTPKGIVRMKAKGSPGGRAVSFDASQTRKVISLIRRYPTLKISLKLNAGYHVIDAYTDGFAKAWRKGGFK